MADEVNWKVMQAYVNQVLRDGSRRYAEEILEARYRARQYRAFMKFRNKDKRME